MDVEKIANLIKTKRKEKGYTQEELASKLGVTEKAISRWETSKGTPDISLLIPLSKELGISVSELLNGKENKSEEKSIEKIIDYININKKQKHNSIITISSFLYIVLMLLYLLYLKYEYSHNFEFSYQGRIVINLFFIGCIIFINNLMSKYYYDTLEERTKFKKITYITILVIYMIMLFNLTLFTRNINGYTYNLIPFKTLINYWRYPSMYNTIVNVIGNIWIYMPIQYLVIKIFKINKFRYIVLIDALIVCLVEFLQFITHTGVLDIDDIILNLIGMFLMCFLMLKKYRKLYSFKTIVLSLILAIIVTLFTFESLSWYHFGDVPTKVVLFRLIIFCFGMFVITYFVIKIVKLLIRK